MLFSNLNCITVNSLVINGINIFVIAANRLIINDATKPEFVFHFLTTTVFTTKHTRKIDLLFSFYWLQFCSIHVQVRFACGTETN